MRLGAPGRDSLDDVTAEVVWVDRGSDAHWPESIEECHATVAAPAFAPDDVLRAEHVAKRFGAVVALSDCNLHLRRGEALGLIGDNASGKSTLLKIIAGFHRPDLGRIIVRGAPVELRSVDHARSLGIDCVYQDLALIDELSVWENIFLRRETVHHGLPFLARRRMRGQARVALDDLGVRIASVDLPVGSLSGGQRQAVALARSLRSAAEIVLLDEPIAAMGVKQSAAILDMIERLRDQRSVSVILVAHNYANVLRACDRVNLLEGGGVVLDKPASDTSIEELASW